jgi:6-phosphofructokinase
LALMAAVSVGADYVFLPERPPPLDQKKYGTDWQSEMCNLVKQNRKLGSKKTLVIVCEGAIDQNLAPIKSEAVKAILESINLETRVTTLGFPLF